MNAPLHVRVSAARLLTPLVREFTLVPCTGTLPGFSSGSHVQVHLPLGGRTLRNAYSLTGDPADHRQYRIAVEFRELKLSQCPQTNRGIQLPSKKTQNCRKRPKQQFSRKL